MNFKILNRIIAVLLFFFASTVYIKTMEPHASFWDCGEYITAATKLEVTHAPGAAFFQLMGAVLSTFAFGNKMVYASIINGMSCLCSAMAIMFVFWNITHMIRRLLIKKKPTDLSLGESLITLGSGLIGALSLCFSETFWFSAVEGEVYAMSTLFVVLAFWFMLQWEEAVDKNQNRADKWLILICFLIGLSSGVRMIVLLEVPALGLIYFFKKYQPTLKRFLLAHLIIAAITGFIFKIIFIYTLKFFWNTELFLVNGLGMPFNSGTVFAVILLLVFFASLLYYTQKKNKVFLNKISLGIFFMLIGFSCYFMIPIRSNANPPINLNAPTDALSLIDYMNRKQYGDWPTLYGATYAAYINEDGYMRDKQGNVIQKEDGKIYEKNTKTNKYEIIHTEKKIEINPKYKSVLPRMYSPDPRHIRNYRSIAGNVAQGKNVGFLQQIEYLINYQLGYMYFRYFLWNFVGRQNDYQGNFEAVKGNWKSGIGPIDDFLLGPQENLPYYYKHNKANTSFYFIPFILGCLGFVFLMQRNPEYFYALLSVFVLTGMGVLFYTSVKPFEPRERDYAYTSSFYVFCLWIGIGVYAIYSFIASKIKNQNIAAYFALILSISSPLLLGFKNWDGHNRSKRHAAHALAKNYLEGLEPNAILFVYGDNDTYPLWYLQEVEGIRTDVKVVNYTLLGTAWNIDQVKRRTYNAEALPGQLTHEQYREGRRDALFFQKNETETVSVKSLIDWISQDKNQAQSPFNDQSVEYIPVNQLFLPVNKANALQSKIINAQQLGQVLDTLHWQLKENATYTKNDLAFLDLLANFDWKRPIYFSSGGVYEPKNILYLNNYLQFEGFVYKLVPIKTNPDLENELNLGFIETESLYKKVKQYDYANMKDSTAYFDETARNPILTHRITGSRLAQALLKENKPKKAVILLDQIMENIPQAYYQNHISLIDFITVYIKADEPKKAETVFKNYKKDAQDRLLYFTQLPKHLRVSVQNELGLAAYEYAHLCEKTAKVYIEKGHENKARQIVNESIAFLAKIVKDKQKQISINELETILYSLQRLLELNKTLDPEATQKQEKQLIHLLDKNTQME